MGDVAYLALVLAFFALASAYIRGCTNITDVDRTVGSPTDANGEHDQDAT